MNRTVATVSLLLLVAASPALAAGLLKPKDSSLPALQIKDHSVHVVINNGFAVTEVDQVFHNPHDQDLDAVYTFPLPKDASLSELSLWIDGREVVGEVVEKEEARRVYREERSAGRDTALAEKREYIAFDVLVSPVRAGSDTRVRLLYLQPIEIDTGVGRYVYPLEEGGIDEELQEFWDRLPRVHGHLVFNCDIRSSYPLDDVRAKGFEEIATVTQHGPDSWNVRFDGQEGSASLDRDIVVYYRLAEKLPARVDLLPYRVDDGPGTFMVVITPGNDLNEITEGVDWTVVLDLSGSMSGKIATAADAVSGAFDQLRPGDRFRVIVFSNKARLLTDGWRPVTPNDVEEVKHRLQGLGTEGGTNLFAGVESAMRGLEVDRTSAILIVSDGGANVGPTEHSAFLKLLDQKDVRVFTFVMGQGANRPLLEKLATESNGFAMDISNEDDLYGRLLQAKAKLGREAMHGVRVDLEGADVLEVAPGRLPSAYFGQQIVFFGRYRTPAVATLRLRARISGQEREWETRIELPFHDETYPEIERLWALGRVRDLKSRIDNGENENELRKAIVDVGTEYSIVTDYTSMIVVEEERFEDLGIERKNRDRVARERKAREVRWNQHARDTRADRNQPMYGSSSSHGFGLGSAGPGLLAALAALLGARACLRRRSRR